MDTIKFLHVLSACLFVGNNVVTPFWRFFAERTRDAGVIRFSQRLLSRTDMVFNGGGIAVLLTTGHLMAARLPGLWQQSWFVGAYACFSLSGVLWLTVLLPIQVRQTWLLGSAPAEGPIPDEFWKLSRKWNTVGAVATLLPLVSLFLMVK